MSTGWSLNSLPAWVCPPSSCRLSAHPTRSSLWSQGQGQVTLHWNPISINNWGEKMLNYLVLLIIRIRDKIFCPDTATVACSLWEEYHGIPAVWWRQEMPKVFLKNSLTPLLTDKSEALIHGAYSLGKLCAPIGPMCPGACWSLSQLAR